jgi:hypothetical protein
MMIGLLVIAFLCNELIRPVHPRFHRDPVADQIAEVTVPPAIGTPA